METGRLVSFKFTLSLQTEVRQGQIVSRCTSVVYTIYQSKQMIHKFVDICSSHKAVPNKAEEKGDSHPLH